MLCDCVVKAGMVRKWVAVAGPEIFIHSGVYNPGGLVQGQSPGIDLKDEVPQLKQFADIL